MSVVVVELYLNLQNEKYFVKKTFTNFAFTERSLWRLKKVNIFSDKSTFLLNTEVHSVRYSAVWKIEKFILTEKSFVKSIYLVISLVCKCKISAEKAWE